MSEFVEGEYVDITIQRVRVRESRPDIIDVTEVLSVWIGDHAVAIPMTQSVTVERVAPAEWPPRPGDVWGTDDGGRWFAARYVGDPEFPKDYEGCNGEGWRTVLVPMDVGPYGSGIEGRPDDVRRTAGRPLFLVHREDEQDGGDQ